MAHDDKDASAPADPRVGGPLARERYPIGPMLQAWERAGGDPEGPPRHLHAVGVDGAQAAFLLADLARRTGRPVLAVTSTDEAARELTRDLRVFVQDEQADPEATPLPGGPDDPICLYPEYDVGPFHQASPDRKLTMRRLATLHRLCCTERPAPFVVSSARALMRRTLPPEAMRRWSHTWAVEDELDNRWLRDYLTDCGYTEVPVVEDPGTFAIRGDIVDVFIPSRPHPVRIERWGDEIAEIRTFHPSTQRTTSELERCQIFPVRQEILDREAVSLAHERLHRLGTERAAPTSDIQTALGDLRAGIHFIGIDALLPALHPELADLCDYAPEGALLALIKPHAVLESMTSLWEKRQREQQVAHEQAGLYFDASEYYRTPASFARWADARAERLDVSRVHIEGGVGAVALEPAPEAHTFQISLTSNDDIVRMRKSCRGVEQTLQAFAQKLDEWVTRYGRICITCRTRSQMGRLERMLRTFWGGDVLDVPPPIDLTEPLAPPAGLVEIYHAPLDRGFRSELLSAAVIAGPELFGQRVSTRAEPGRAFSEQAAISHFRELSIGDLVVHVDFGIGRYLGLTHLVVEDIGNDFLHIEYADGKLYLPVYRLGRLQRYIGSSEHTRLDKLKGGSWEKTKDKVKDNIRAIAGELLALYARREMAKGYAFSPPGEMFQEFEAAFPFEETPDQARAIAETLQDMMRPRTMDRLVCGDVGFGKTEVAIRAAMKAALDGKQVAVLVPTTILAEQHQISFRERMEEFGVEIGCLSRFRTGAEARQIIERCKKGALDILIGTHRILNKKVEFRDLGLLIVDEEQRFGVTHKEKIKRLKSDIDVLTLSATPIPRTLQMSLLGIRDLSIIATPPHNRLAVRTHVAKFSDGVIREAIMRELSRGGRVFFVHNRVATIEEMAEHLGELIPEARIGIGHGQMKESKLEGVMLSYIQGKINVLLCSSIIESGLDIPNANTIILNRADMFGLSQLYQLRGRVGRGTERAYAYLLIPARRKLPPDAERRLEVIQTHTELGSGFHVASYDLEIRGAGSLLGDDQSGHVTAVGLDLYNELLEEAVHDLRGEEVDDEIDPEVNIPVASFLPEEYIPATSLRLMFYKRFSLAQSLEELDEVFDEMIDRFGQPPEPVLNLRQIVAVKIGLRQIRARRLDAGPSAISVELDQKTPLDPQAILGIAEQTRGRLEITAAMKLIYRLRPDESARPLQTARELMDRLLATLGEREAA